MKMSDVMLYGILRMPYELAMNDEVSRFQFYENAQRAGDRIEELESLLEDCYKIQKMQAEEVYKGNAKIEEMEKIIREGIQAFGAVQEQQLKDKFDLSWEGLQNKTTVDIEFARAIEKEHGIK